MFCRHVIFAICLLLTSPRLSIAKKEKETESPSSGPSNFPSTSPSFVPSLSPTSFPTKEPTTPFPTASPSSAPTSKNTATLTETLTEPLTEPLTKSPTESPTETPTGSMAQNSTEAQESTPSSSTTQVEVPLIGFDLILDDDEASSPAVAALEGNLNFFVEEVLSTNSGDGTLDHATFDFDVIFSEFNRRRLTTGLSIMVIGTAYYSDSAPTTEELNANLKQYFSIWGTEDLRAFLSMKGLRSARVAAVYIDGDSMTLPSEETADSHPGAQVKNPSYIQGTSSLTVTPGIIIGLIVGAVILLSSMLFAVYQIRRVRSKKKNDPPAEKPVQYSGVDDMDDGGDEFDDKEEQSKNPTWETPDDDESTGGMSVDLSVYTSNTGYVLPQTKPAPANTYDPKRLDKVIAMAKERSNL